MSDTDTISGLQMRQRVNSQIANRSKNSGFFQSGDLKVVEDWCQMLAERNLPATGVDRSALINKVLSYGTTGNSIESYLNNRLGPLLHDEFNLRSPRFVGHMTGPVNSELIVLSMLLTLVNVNPVKLETARAISEIERQRIAEWHSIIFKDNQAGKECFEIGKNFGFFTNGGTTANMQALAIARNIALNGPEGAKDNGLAVALRAQNLRGACIIAPRHAHYSLAKSADILGLGENGVVKVANDELGRMDCGELVSKIDQCRQENIAILAVVGVAGATETGAIDPLSKISQICKQHGIWFHVDASWGGPLALSKNYCDRLDGIENADSVTICLHKMLRMPMGNSIVLFKDPTAADNVEKSAKYIIRKGSADLGRYTLEGSRGGGALYWDAAVSMHGIDGIGNTIDHHMTASKRFAQAIRNRNAFRLMLEPESGIVNYIYVPSQLRQKDALSDQDLDIVDRAIVFIQDAQKAAGTSFVSRTAYSLGSNRGHSVFRAVLLNEATTDMDFHAILDEQEAIGRDFEAA